MSRRPIVASLAQNGIKPPLQRVEPTPAVVLADGGDGLARRQVITRLRGGADELVEAEELLEHLGRDEQPEPAAHVTP